MSTNGHTTTTQNNNDDERRTASEALYAAENALHAARQSGIDSWIKAAGDRLHEAVVRYEAITGGTTSAVA